MKENKIKKIGNKGKQKGRLKKKDESVGEKKKENWFKLLIKKYKLRAYILFFST